MPGLPPSTDPVPTGLLAGQVAVVTAAAGTGIGFATARRFALEGAAVMLSDVHPRRLDESCARLSEEVSTPIEGIVCDVTAVDQVEHLYDETERRLGPIDVAFNNAGLGGRSFLVEMTDAEWSRVLDVTLYGTMRCTRALLRRMCPRRRGVIVNNASVTGWRAEATQCHYGAAKAGVMALTRCAAVEAAPFGVRVNAVAPTVTMHEHLARAVGADMVAAQAAAQIQGRAAAVWEIASVVVFLASTQSAYLSGEVISTSSQHP